MYLVRPNTLLVRLCNRIASRVAPALYDWFRSEQDNLATRAFRREVEKLGRDSGLQHPFRLKGSKYISIGCSFWAGPSLRIEAWDEYFGERFSPEIDIGDNVAMNTNVHIGAVGKIKIGNHVLIGSNVLITDHDHGSGQAVEAEIPPQLRPLRNRGSIIIEDNVWIGEGACVLGGVRVGAGSIIGANAVVTRDVQSRSIVGGVPAKLIRKL